MNANERKKYQQEYEQVNRRFTAKYSPKVKKAVGSLVSSLISDIKASGAREAMNNLSMTLVNERLGTVLRAMYKEVGLFHARRNYRLVRAEMGQKGRIADWLTEIQNYLTRHLLEKAVLTSTQNARDSLMKLMQDAIDKGMSEFEMIKYVQDNGIRVLQPQRIVRTEMNIASNAGTMVAAKSFRLAMVKEWIAHRDIRTRGFNSEDRHDHFHMDGLVVDLDEKFTDPKSGEQIDYPSAPGGSAGMVINCRCTYATVPKRDKDGRLVKI